MRFLVYLLLGAIGLSAEEGDSLREEVEATIPAGMILPRGATASVFADHQNHQVLSPIALDVAEDGSLLVTEAHRLRHGVPDNRDHRYWVLDDMASLTTADRSEMYQKWKHETPLGHYVQKTEKIRSLTDRDGDGVADESKVFAQNFQDELDGMAGGVLSLNGVVYFGCVPHLWALQDSNGDKVADLRVALQSGFGVRVSLSGHDLHGFELGPDGRIYGTMGDRAMNLTTKEGLHYQFVDQGAAFRFEPDGSHFEVLHVGLRNPKGLAFNQLGDVFVVDDDAEMGDKSRIVLLVDGGDSGWRSDYQNLYNFHHELGLDERPLHPWTKEKMWETANSEQPAWMLPPIGHLGKDPAGLAFQPGSALGGALENFFFLCDYDGQPESSGVWAFDLLQHGASYRQGQIAKFVWGIGATDIEFGFNGSVYISDFMRRRAPTPQGRIVEVKVKSPHFKAQEVARLIGKGLDHLKPQELATLFSYPDMRVRVRAQLALAKRPKATAYFKKLLEIAPELLREKEENLLLPSLGLSDSHDVDEFHETSLVHLHSIWGLAILARQNQNLEAVEALVAELDNPNSELRAQAAKAIGESRLRETGPLITALEDSSDRVRFFAALSLGRLRSAEAVPSLLKLAMYAAANDDPVLRHAVVVGLSGCSNSLELASFSSHALPSVRMAALLALRRLGHVGVNRFLFDHTSEIRREAIRVIHDTPIEAARPSLPVMIDELLTQEGREIDVMSWHRLIHSAFRLSGQENAERLVKIAASERVPLTERKEALRLLEQWVKPFPVDQSTGRHTPLRPRPLTDVRSLIRNQFAPFLQEQSPVYREATQLAAKYGVLPEGLSDDVLGQLVKGEANSTKVRVIALDELAKRDGSEGKSLLLEILASSEDAEASPVELRLKALEHFLAEDPIAAFPYFEQGLRAEQFLQYRQGVANLLLNNPDPRASFILVNYLDGLRYEEAPDHEIALEMITAAEKGVHRDNPEVQKALRLYRDFTEKDPLTTHFAALVGGDPSRGRQLFHHHPIAECARCHSVHPKVDDSEMEGPNLSATGKNSRRYLLESLVYPSAQITAGYAPITAIFINGDAVTGTLLANTEEYLELLLEGKPARFLKTEIESLSRPKSIMPASSKILPIAEIRDLVAYLATLKEEPLDKKPLAQNPKPHQLSLSPEEEKTMADDTTTSTATEILTPATPAIPNGIDPAVWELGKTQYATCLACHQPTGLGIPAAFPPLAESEWVVGPAENLIRMQLRGLMGEIEVKGQTYNSVMPPMPHQTDEQIAAVLTYVRNSFGNSASAVTPEMVTEFRGEVGQPMLTVADLIDPSSVPVEGDTPEASPHDGDVPVELAPALAPSVEMPKASSNFNFPFASVSAIFLVIVLVVAAKFVFGKKK